MIEKTWTWWVTVISIVVGVIGMIAWDLYPATNKTSGDTISEVVANAARAHMLVPAFLGVVCGHFFSPFPITLQWWQTIVVLSSSAVLLVVLDLVHMKTGLSVIAFLETWPIITFQIFVLVGAVCWSQGQ